MARIQNVILNVYLSIFSNRDFVYKRKTYPLEYTGKFNRLRKIEIGDLLFIEQNPRTKSIYAKKARQGARIMWVIKKRNSKFLAVVIRGEVKIFHQDFDLFTSGLL